MRAGFVLTTQPFQIKDLSQVWEVNIGFKRRAEAMPVRRFMCVVNSRNDPLRRIEKCTNDEPGVKVKWELLRDSTPVGSGYAYDALQQGANSQSSRASFLLGLSTIAYQLPGAYRLRFEVLRDFPELDITDPHVVIDKPFFR
jgi:hypothetical protein